jgi:hypothetical protein
MLVGFLLGDIVNFLAVNTNGFSILELHITYGAYGISSQLDIRIVKMAFEIGVRTNDHITNTTLELFTFRINTSYIHR